MRMKKMTRILAVCMMAILLVGTTMGVHAQSVTETEPNDTMETAELISPNRQTPQEFLDGQEYKKITGFEITELK